MTCNSNVNNEKAKAAINAYATYLASRFNPVVGCTMSWDPPSADPTEFQVRPYDSCS